jgi:hypothetical protein
MKKVLAAIAYFCLVLALVLSAPSLCAQKVAPSSQLTTLTSSPSAMETVLADLERVTVATDNDIADMRQKHGSWLTAWMFWRRESSLNPATDKMAASLQRNLHSAMPGLIHDAQSSGGFFSTFKLYNNLSVACEMLDSLVAVTKSEGKNNPLANDSAAMGRIRQQLATQIELSAAALDSRGKAPYSWSASSLSGNGGKVKRIVVDDTVPQKKAVAKKKTVISQP